MSSCFNGGIIVFAIIQAIQTRGVQNSQIDGANAQSAMNSLAAFQEAVRISVDCVGD